MRKNVCKIIVEINPQTIDFLWVNDMKRKGQNDILYKHVISSAHRSKIYSV